MATIYSGVSLDDLERRSRIYDGSLVLTEPNDATEALCTLARSMITDTFAPYEPLEAQYHLPVEEWSARFAAVKPTFIHHPSTLQLLRNVVAAAGCDVDDTYIDVPRLRGVTSHGYLTSGVGYAHHPHRDTWYSAPMCQINWWVPVFDFATESSMAFHPRYFARPVRNGSSDFNYYRWNANQRKEAAKHIRSDTRKQPKPEEHIELEPDVRVVCRPGGAIVFSAAQLHSTVANTSGRARFSIDFRTVSLEDLMSGRGAPNVDSAPTGTSLRDFVRSSDLTGLPEEIIARYDHGAAPTEGVLVYRPTA